MKKLKFGLIFGITCILTMSQLQLPAMANVESKVDFECPEGVVFFIRDPLSCNHFYICSMGIKAHSSCAPGLYFDRVYGLCNVASQVNCEGRPVTPIL